MASWPVIPGCEWENNEMRIFPERVAKADLVIVQRDFPRYFEAYQEVTAQAREQGKILVYEIDDLLTELPETHPDYDYYRKSRANVLTAVCEADAVVCSTSGIGEYLHRFNSNVRIYPNYLDDQLWSPGTTSEKRDRKSNHAVVLGYLGSHSHMQDLESIVPALERLLDRFGDGLIIRLWGIRVPPALSGYPNVEVDIPGLVNYAEFVAYFRQQECDVFIAPLADNQFNRCKSAIKSLEYSALGVPGVYSNLPTYSSVIKHGENGYLASSLEEWELFLSELIETPELRTSLGDAAAATVQADWLLSDHIDQWTNIYLDSYHTSHKNIPLDSALLDKMRAWQDEYEGELIRYDQVTARIQEEQDHRNQAIGRMQEELEQRNLEIGGLKEEIRGLNSKLDEYTGHIVGLEATIQSINQQVDSLQNQIGQLTAVNQIQREEIAQYQTDITRQDVKIQGLNLTIENKDKLIDMYNSTVLAIQSSAGWKLLEVLYKIRLILIPRNTYRERLLFYVIKSARILKSEGLSSLVKKGLAKILAKESPLISEDLSSVTTPQIIPAQIVEPCPSPAISVIIEKNASQSSIDNDRALCWVKEQTLNSVEVIVWEKDLKIAQVLYPISEVSSVLNWEAVDIKTLCQGMGGRYICMASEDLLRQNPTYLEENLIALESENILFTVNALGKTDHLAQELSLGFLPGDPKQPLLRQVVRKDYLNNDYSIDILSWAARFPGLSCVAGKIISHATNQMDTKDSLPFDVTIENIQVMIQGRYLLVRTLENLPWNANVTIKPVDKVMPLSGVLSNAPTVLVVLQFLAVGGAEQLALNVIKSLLPEFRFIILSVDELDPTLGTTSDLFRELTPFVYNAMDYLNPHLRASFLWYLIERFHPSTIYIANGALWIYDVLRELKQRYPEIRTVNQVYDHQVGWINRYDINLVLNIDAHIGANKKICQAYMYKGARPEKVYLIEHGIDPSDLNPDAYSQTEREAVRKKLGLPETGRVVTFASRLHPQKRPVDFLELARRFAFDPTVIFLMAGDGPLAGTVDELAVQMELKNFYRRPFYRPIRDILAISDVVVLPSEYEGMPLIVAEAQVMGKPVVVTDVGNNREVLGITQGGVIISKIGNVDELASGVRQMLESPPDPVHLRQALLAHFGIDNIAKKYRGVLLGVASA
jgi:glycosyltransferase involved in cell wall biosynthesis